MSQQQQSLVANIIAEQQRRSAFADVECPDCSAPLDLYYDEQDRTRHYCQDCRQEVNDRDIKAEWDDSEDDEDNNISTIITVECNIGVL